MVKVVTMVTALALATPGLCSGQGSQDPTRLEIDRGALTRLLAHYEAVAQSTAYSEELRAEGQAQADLIRERLRMGDFRPGDQITLFIEGEASVQWDTLTVGDDQQINVPTLGPIALQGVLRSELENHLAFEIGRFIQSPSVRAQALLPVSILGVGRPGFYTLPADLPLSEAIMLAGGPGAGADPGEIRVERGQEVLWTVEELRAPVAGGSTLDDLGIRAGDRIVLPAVSPADSWSSIYRPAIQSALYIVIPLLLGVGIR